MDEDDRQEAGRGEGDAPGKTRTWWHPLLVQVLDFVLAGAYRVVGELVVGKMPLSVDIFLVRREDGQLSELAKQSAPL